VEEEGGWAGAYPSRRGWEGKRGGKTTCGGGKRVYRGRVDLRVRRGGKYGEK